MKAAPCTRFSRRFLMPPLTVRHSSRAGPSERTALRSIGAVLLTAAVWAVVHHQYHIYDQLWIFVFGLVLGASRVISGSVYPAIAIHVLNNLVAYLAVGLYLGEYPPAM